MIKPHKKQTVLCGFIVVKKGLCLQKTVLKNVEFTGFIGILDFLATVHLCKNTSARKKSCYSMSILITKSKKKRRISQYRIFRSNFDFLWCNLMSYDQFCNEETFFAKLGHCNSFRILI